ncbi:SMI1/KNR4 family protein [Actinoplanes lobatus]|nr:SMI1/KNR4 family protein [Actinoplanes lobatus]
MEAFAAEVNSVLEQHAAKGLPSPPFDSWIASDAELARVESELRVRLPEKYKQFMVTFGAGQFMYMGLIPPASPNGQTRDMVEKNSGDHEIPGFVSIAAVGTGDHWGFITEDGICSEQVSLYDFEESCFYPEADDFLEFVSWQGLHAGREGY